VCVCLRCTRVSKRPWLYIRKPVSLIAHKRLRIYLFNKTLSALSDMTCYQILSSCLKLHFRLARESYYARRDEGIGNDDVTNLIIDGMDQRNPDLPHFTQMPKVNITCFTKMYNLAFYTNIRSYFGHTLDGSADPWTSDSDIFGL
jgi:hypothetical protein